MAASTEPAPGRRQPPAERRRQLLDAAERVLLAHGLAAATVADVAEAAGVAKGTMYLYYPSKTDLIAAVRARYLERVASELELAISEHADARTRLDRFVEAFVTVSTANRDLHHLLFHESGFSEADAFASARRLLGRLVADGVADGTLDPGDEAAATDFALAGIHAALVDLLHGTVTDPRGHVEEIARIAARTLGATDRTTDADGPPGGDRAPPAPGPVTAS